MNYPTQFMKILGLLTFLLLFFLSSTLTVRAADKLTLTGMEKQEKLESTRITLQFAALPEFDIEHNGQRVDLLLKEVWLSNDLKRLPEDETVVKILLAQKHRDLLASFLLRRAPKQVMTETKKNPARIIIDLFWAGDQGARPGVAFRINDMPARKAGKKAKDYEKESPWVGRWRDFYREYRSDWKLELPLSYTLWPLPPLVNDQQSSLWPLQQLAIEGKWLSLIRKAGQVTGLDPEQAYLRNLLVAEAQLRSEAFASGLQRLDILRDLQGPQQIRVEYLTAYGQAASGQPFIAILTIQELLAKLTEDEPLAAFSYLLAAESALASKQPKKALEYLQSDKLVWPMELLPVVDLRSADALAGMGQVEAVGAYLNLSEEQGLFEHYLSSLNRAAFSAYKNAAYEFSYELYRKLNDLVKEGPGADLIQFAAGASAYAAGNIDWGLIGLQKASLDWPGYEGGERAEVRLIDHKLLNGGEYELAQAVNSYAQLGQQASNRMVREEATFKQALALFLLTDYQESVDELMRFRREFGSSKLRREADLLLLKQLPIVVHNLREQKNELAAVVLVEKNRKLLLRGGFDRAFLHDLAAAFDSLGLYARAGRVLLYLFDQATDEQQRKSLYLPLAKSYLKRNEFQYASNYAGRYLQKYPRGEDSGALFGVLLDAFEKQERYDELISWLARKDRPSSAELEIRAAWIYWQQEQLEDVARSLELALETREGLLVKEMALLAETYYLLQRNNAAEKIYRQLSDDKQYGTQARYRSAQLLLRQGDRSAALNLLQQLVDEDVNSSWGKLAQDLLIMEKQ